MHAMKIALINEKCTAGATRCARDIERHLSTRHVFRYYPRHENETMSSILDDLAKFRTDVVHCHSYYGDLPYRFLARVSHRYPTCFTVHDPRPVGAVTPSSIVCWDCPRAQVCFRCALVSRWQKMLLLNPYFWLRLKKRFFHWRTASTVHIVSPSRWLDQRLKQSELKRFAIHHIPNAIDTELFRPIPNARTVLGFSHDQALILYVAHAGDGWASNPRKGLMYLADAFVKNVLSRYPNALLLVAGEGLVPNHPQVRPLGFIEQDTLPLYYSAADVLAMPTLADNLPYTILEAMACGTPVVASNVGGISEEIDDGVTGYLCRPGDANDLGAALLTLLSSSAQRKMMGEAGRKRVEQLFGMDMFIQRYENLYHDIFNQYHTV